MQKASQGLHQTVTSVFFMPMLDLKSSDEICIYSTMCFARGEENDITVPIFSQWLKSFKIQISETSNKDI